MTVRVRIRILALRVLGHCKRRFFMGLDTSLLLVDGFVRIPCPVLSPGPYWLGKLYYDHTRNNVITCSLLSRSSMIQLKALFGEWILHHSDEFL